MLLNQTRGTGLYASGYNPSDITYTASNLNVPKSYKIGNMLPIYDQGSLGSCVSVTVMEMYWNYLTNKNQTIEFPNSRTYLYNRRPDMKVDGMMPRDAFNILLKENRIQTFAKVGGIPVMKSAILANGAALIGLMVKSFNDDFWNGNEKHGGHAVAVVGWDEYGLLIKNSWGCSYGEKGFYTLPYDDFRLVTEAWTIIS